MSLVERLTAKGVAEEEPVGPELEAKLGEGEITGTKSGKEEGSTRRAPHLREPPKERWQVDHLLE